MPTLKSVLLASVVVGGIAYLWGSGEPPLPTLDPNPWWGPGDPKPEDSSIRPFKIEVSKEELADLHSRLALPLRLAPPLENANFTYGFSSDALRKIVDYWRHEYDWKAREARLNSFPHFKTRIEGIDIHFLRAKADTKGAKNLKVVPLLLIHGWPGSIVEFYDILPFLTTPQEGSGVVFEVICPSIPGYGFSQASAKQGLGMRQTGQIFLKLMKRLGFPKFYLQGGDWGSGISTEMSTYYPENILGVHLNLFTSMGTAGRTRLFLGAVIPSGLLVDSKDWHKVYPLGETFKWLLRESGYAHIQATKPDTVGAALNQSPVGLAAYIIEKFSTWTNRDNVFEPDGGLLNKNFPISLDKLLDNICVYWFTGSITSSMRFYAENMNSKNSLFTTENIAVRVPTGLAAFPNEIANYPRQIVAHKYHQIVTFTDLKEGGHFPAMERPADLAQDVHRFVSIVENKDA